MKVSVTENGLEFGADRGNLLAALALRVKSLERRFPSMSQSLLSIFDQAWSVAHLSSPRRSSAG